MFLNLKGYLKWTKLVMRWRASQNRQKKNEHEQGMEDAEFHGEFENATYFLF